jgi:hypothetical protein
MRGGRMLLGKTATTTFAVWGAASLTGFGGAPNWLFGPGILVMILMVFMSVEIGTNYRRNPAMGDDYPWTAKVASKVMLLSLVVVAFLLDLIVIVGMSHVPDGVSWDAGPWARGFPLVTVGAIVWLCVGEGAKIVDHVEKAEGPGAVPPVILWVLRFLRRADEARFRKVHDDGRPVPKRWTDSLSEMTEEDMAEFLKFMESRNAVREAPERVSGDGG